MITFVMHCPVHNYLLQTQKQIQYEEIDGTAKKAPIFECTTCKKYYVYDPSKNGMKVGTYGNNDVFATDSIWKMHSEWDGGIKGISGKTPVPSGVIEHHKVLEKIVRIRRESDEIFKHAKANLQNIRIQFPEIATDKMSVSEFLWKVCGNLINVECVYRNLSYTIDDTHFRKIEFYIKDSAYLKHKLPENIYISFMGRLSNGEFVMEEIRVLEALSISNGWKTEKLRFAFDGPKKDNWFYDATDTDAELSDELVGELKLWNDYLEWKRSLAQLRIKGFKYIDLKADLNERKIIFLTVVEGEKQLKEFKRLLNRDEISAFSKNYSKNRWIFEFNKTYQSTEDNGVNLVFSEYGKIYYSDLDVKDSDWKLSRKSPQKYKDDDKNLALSEKISEISRNYKEPIYQEIIFEFTDHAMELVQRDIKRNGEITGTVERAIYEEFYVDGFLANSQIGDFALLNRLQKAINDLSNGKSAKQNLEQWLFDVTKADKPNQIEKINEWQNPDINHNQKIAVEKIISCPDVCLIQGPPGTGKTTVIAEAIYQLVVRGKRVLVASQANLAVDNALERLISNPKIRAIRLGKENKIDESVKNITEEHVLETFYSSIVKYINTDYLAKWLEIDEIQKESKDDLKNYRAICTEIDSILSEIDSNKKAIAKIKESIVSEDKTNSLSTLVSEKMSAVIIVNCCDRKTTNVELMLGKLRIEELWNAIEDTLFSLKNGGVCLTKVGIDTSTSSKIYDSNKIIKYILLNTLRVFELYEQLKKDTEFGGESAELEMLKLREKDIRGKMMSDPSLITEWQAISLQIQQYTKDKNYVNDSDLLLFDGITALQENDRKNFIIDVIEKNLILINKLMERIKEISLKFIQDIDEQISSIENGENKKQAEIVQIELLIKEYERRIREKKEEIQVILNKYNATNENIERKMAEYFLKQKSLLETDLDRNKWFSIFKGLHDWVDNIPDYSQEKDIFLKEYINGCNVVGVSCTENTRTLTENGFDDFDVVIIDEVSKATPPELLIPMLRGRKIVLVGDHRQLPPLFNEHEKSYEEIAKQQDELENEEKPLTMDDFIKYKDMVTSSLFERHFETADEAIKQTLTSQYRMHRDIMDLINLFYDGLLDDGNEDDYTEDTKAHYLSIYSNFGTEMIVPEKHAYWFDSSQLGGKRIFEQRREGSPSIYNTVEAETILELLKKIENQYENMSTISKPVSVGVISFYFDQVSLIRKMLSKESFHAIDIEVNTVDRFQGKEKDIVLVSLVRNKENPGHNLNSYIAAFQRINVAFSRAKNLLVILGATDMYSDQPVEITDMNNGEEKIIYPYKQIQEMMNTNGTYFPCDEVLSENKVDEILMHIALKGVDEE